MQSASTSIVAAVSGICDHMQGNLLLASSLGTHPFHGTMRLCLFPSSTPFQQPVLCSTARNQMPLIWVLIPFKARLKINYYKDPNTCWGPSVFSSLIFIFFLIMCICFLTTQKELMSHIDVRWDPSPDWEIDCDIVRGHM